MTAAVFSLHQTVLHSPANGPAMAADSVHPIDQPRGQHLSLGAIDVSSSFHRTTPREGGH